MNAYIELEQQNIWLWQVFRFIRDGWEICDNQSKLLRFTFRLRVERCIG